MTIEEKEEFEDELLEISQKNNSVIMAIVASYVGEKISPTKIQNAHVNVMDEFSVESAIEDIQRKTDCKKLMLLLNSPGGSVTSSYKIARALRTSFEDITVYIPHIAASGGTLIALIGNVIVMGIMSQLSPLDPIIDEIGGRPISAKLIVDANNALTAFFETTSMEDAPYTTKILADKYDPVQIQEAESIMDLMERYISEMLKKSNYLESDCQRIAHQLVRGFSIHEEVITDLAAKELGLKIKSCTEYPKEWAIMRKWLGTLLLKSSGTHLIRYYLHPSLIKNHSAESQLPTAEIWDSQAMSKIMS
jgi:ClpP class serine protease